MEPSFKEEALTLGHMLTACRLVFETALACRVLPYPIAGHRTYNITELNNFISSQKESILAFYNDLLQSVDIDSIKVPDYEQAK